MKAGNSTVMILGAAILLMMILPGLAFAGQCPAGASDCFLCGANGIPCTTKCTGKWSKTSGTYISCECPQGKSCQCYCPYELLSNPRCVYDPTCLSQYLSLTGAPMYIADVQCHGSERPYIMRRTGVDEPLDRLTLVYSGEAIVTPEDCVVEATYSDGGGTVGLTDLSMYILPATATELVGSSGKAWFKVNGNTPETVSAKAVEGENYDSVTSIRSEVVFELGTGNMTVKVLEGKATIARKGKEIIVETGKQFTYTLERFNSSDVKPYDFTKEEQWWTKGIENINCSNACSSGERQTPFPGCSCVPRETAGGTTGSTCCSSGFILVALIAIAMKR